MRPAGEVAYNKKMKLDHVLTFSFSNLFRQKASYGQWLLLSLIVVIINLIPVGVMLLGFDFNSSIPFYSSPESAIENVNAGIMGVAAILFLIVFIFDIFFAFYSSAWFLRTGLDGYDFETRTFGERISKCFSDLGPIAAVTFLLGIINFVFMLPYLVTNIMVEVTGNESLAALSMLFYVVFLVIAYFINVKFSCAYGLILEQRKGVIESLKLSWEMTKGRGWRIFGYAFLIALLAGMLVFSIFIPVIILWVIAIVSEFAPAVLGITIVLSVISYMVAICIQYGISCNMPIAVYKRLVIEHEEEELPTLPETQEGVDTTTEVSEKPKDDIQF